MSNDNAQMVQVPEEQHRGKKKVSRGTEEKASPKKIFCDKKRARNMRGPKKAAWGGGSAKSHWAAGEKHGEKVGVRSRGTEKGSRETEKKHAGKIQKEREGGVPLR